MPFHSALSTNDDLDEAVAELVEAFGQALGDRPLDLAVVFASPPLAAEKRLAPLLRSALGARRLIGCSAGGVIGGGHEVEGRPALAVTAGRVSGGRFAARHLRDQDLPNPDAPPSDWQELLGGDAREHRGIIVLSDPFSMRADRLLSGLDFAWPGLPKVGGLVSGGERAGEHRLLLDDEVHRDGALLLGVGGTLALESVVAQGCRPIGAVGSITKCDDNYLATVDGRPALEFLRSQLEGMSEEERERAGRAPMFLGLAMDPFRLEEPGPGDFLVRNIVGYDPSSGTMAISERLGVGRRVQFHLRDADTSAEDLRSLLEHSAEQPTPSAALMFSCLGRGEQLYGCADFDSGLLQQRFPGMPLGGFFCNGEIGPVAGTTHLHGYTSAIALLRED